MDTCDIHLGFRCTALASVQQQVGGRLGKCQQALVHLPRAQGQSPCPPPGLPEGPGNPQEPLQPSYLSGYHCRFTVPTQEARTLRGLQEEEVRCGRGPGIVAPSMSGGVGHDMRQPRSPQGAPKGGPMWQEAKGHSSQEKAP